MALTKKDTALITGGILLLMGGSMAYYFYRQAQMAAALKQQQQQPGGQVFLPGTQQQPGGQKWWQTAFQTAQEVEWIPEDLDPELKRRCEESFSPGPNRILCFNRLKDPKVSGILR